MTPREWHEHIARRLGLGVGFEEFRAAWNAVLDPQTILPDSLFGQLGTRCQLGLLSNTDPIHVARLESSYDFFRYFPQSVRIYSCVVGASKPDPLIFREALKACHVRAEEAIYIDDIAAYAEAARRLGMSGIQYQSPDQLRQELAALGVETPSASTA